MMRGLSFTLQLGEGFRRHVGGQLRKPSAFRLPILTNSETRPVKNLLTYALVFGLGVAATFYYLHHTSSSGGHGGAHHSQAMSSSGHITHGGGLHEHDEINMPGLQGKDTTDQEVNDLKEGLSEIREVMVPRLGGDRTESGPRSSRDRAGSETTRTVWDRRGGAPCTAAGTRCTRTHRR